MKKRISLKSKVQLGIRQEEIHDRIEKKAYEFFLNRGGQHGNDVNDWIEAEKEITAQIR